MSDETQIIPHDDPEGYDAWFRHEVEAGLKEANDPSTVWITLEESDEHVERVRAARDRQLLEKAS